MSSRAVRSRSPYPFRKASVILAATLALSAAACAPLATPSGSSPDLAKPGAPTTTSTTPTTTTPATTIPPTPRLVFGMGTEADGALGARLVQETPVRMLSNWYNGPNDLTWMSGWQSGVVPHAYAAGHAMHLIVWTGDPEVTLSTKYGTACGRAYPLSDRFDADMARLADIFAGNAAGPPLYVTLFTEFQTYPCTDNAWNPNPQTNAYYLALKDRYLEAVSIFRAHAPNARVSLGWGGWQTRWDSPSIGGGRSMFPYFADVMAASQFQSFQAMQSDTNVGDVRNMTATLGKYGPVMLAHYKPDNGSQSTFDADMAAIMTDTYLDEVTGLGLFALSFMDNQNLSASDTAYQVVASAVRRYGA